MSHAVVLIIDFGSQYTRLIARRIREMGILSKILPGDSNLEEISRHSPRAIILSGGPSSVYDEGAPQLAAGFLEFQENTRTPVLGICYGMQLLVHAMGGRVERASHREYGQARISIERFAEIFSELGDHASLLAWMSHGDEIRQLPIGFTRVAKSENRVPAAVENLEKRIFGLQFHPEVTHTEMGKKILETFCSEIAGIRPDWNMKAVAEEQREKIAALVGEDDHVLCALSGGVDSAVAAKLVHSVVGSRLHCAFVDHGLLRWKERERVMDMFRDHLGLPVECIDASEVFLSQLDGVADPEKKRKIIGAEFISAFGRYAESLEVRPKFLVQGTLYPDVIESSPAPSSGNQKFSATIKSHHNVGGLPEKLGFELLEPLRELFKDEVRELGRVLDVPASFLKRHPFPGPGLAVRILGPVTREAIATLQQVDEIFIESLKEEGLYDEIWQAFAVFLPIKSVGVQGDGRTHDNVVGLRAVTSTDGMTADWYPFSHAFLKKVSNRICNQVRGVNRVVYDISSKPPATIEWE